MAGSDDKSKLQPKLNYTPDERSLFGQLFRDCDPEGTGIVTGDAAVKLFQRTRLPEQVLGEIWGLADVENRGFLTQEDFAKALRLIGHYQSQPGIKLNLDLALTTAPLPKFEGINMQTPQVTGYAAPIQAQNSGPIRVPPLPPDRVAEYARLFDRAGAQNGLLQGDVARTSFEKSGLPADVLAHVWNLSDTEQRGALSITEFIIAMHLLASYKAKTLPALPQSIPAGLYEAASRRPPIPSGRPPSARASDLGPIPRQTSGSGLMRGASVRQFTPPVTTSDWIIGDREKAQYDALFDKVDSQKIGIVSGDQAVSFFGDSGLPSEILAQVWDLSNIRRQDSLNRDEFAVAMHLIRSQRGKQIFDVPTELPLNLIPPSLRGTGNPALASSQFPIQQPPIASPMKSNTDDLFGLDALTSSPVAASVPREITGGSGPLSDPFTAKTESPRAVGSSPASQTFFRSFAPTSSFGQSIVAQSTGASAGSGTAAKQASAMDDLLGDTDPEISKRLTKDTSDLANMSNEISTLRTQMQEVQNKKAVTEADLNNSAQQKRDMEQRLELFRAQFEQSRQALAASEEKLGLERGEVAKLGQQITLIDAQAQDVRVKHADVQAQLQGIQRERDGLKEKLRQLNEYVSQTQPEIERMQADLRHQKGMLAITKKQVEKVEDEKTQLEKAKADVAEQQQQIRSQSQSPEAATRPQVARELTASSAMSSPSVASASTNPFMRRTPQQSIDQTASPTASIASNNKFDNIFSTAFVTPSASGAPPVTSFKQESTAFAQPGPQSQPSQSQSGPSIKSSEQGEVPTPSTSPPLSSTYQDSPQVPPPPASRQITSKDLPLTGGDQAQRVHDGESVATSVRVETPLSRYDIGSTPTASATGLDRPETAKSTGHASVGSKGDIEAAFASVGKPASRQNTGNGFDESFPSGPTPSNANDPVAKFNSEFPEINMTNSGKSAAPSTKKEEEFPPIKDLRADDESDSDGAGFDDDFTKATPPSAAPTASTVPVTSSSPTQSKATAPRGMGEDIFGQPSASASHSQGEALFGASKPTTTSTFPFVPTTLPSSPLSSLPPLPASESASVGTARGDTASPDQLRERASDVPSETTFASAVSNQSGSPRVIGAGIAQTSADTISSGTGDHFATESQPGPAVPPKGKSPFDGFDTSMFDKLAPAREADTDARLDDDLLMFGGNQQKGGHVEDEFSATFDAPHTKSQGKKFDDDAFGIGFSEFDNSFVNSLGSNTSAPKPTAASTHDWDAIMKGFDEQPKEFTNSQNNNFEPPEEEFAGPPPEAPEPPKLGRAISTGTEHDDPILKHLMGMGYPRPKALAALEKFDYDIGKASDYLASPK